MINTIVEPEIVKLLRAEEPLARPANGRSRQRPTCCKIVPLPDPRQFDILQSGPGWRGPSIETPRVHHAARRRGGVTDIAGVACYSPCDRCSHSLEPLDQLELCAKSLGAPPAGAIRTLRRNLES